MVNVKSFIKKHTTFDKTKLKKLLESTVLFGSARPLQDKQNSHVILTEFFDGCGKCTSIV